MQPDKDNNLRNRPKAINYAEEQVKRGGGQMTSYYDYLKNDPASYFYQQLKDSPFLKNQYWTEAANKGELDHLVYLLQSTKSDTFDSTAFNKLKGYENFMDYDTYMLALELPHLDNNAENRKPKIFGGHNFGSFTDREWAEKIFDEAIGRWNAEILQDSLETRHWTVRTARNYFVGGGAKIIKFFSGAVKIIDNVANIGIGAYEAILEGTRRGINNIEPIQSTKDLIFSNAFLRPFEEDPSKLRAFTNWLDAVSFELQRSYTTINIDQVKAYDQGWRPDQDSSFFDRVKEGDSAAIGAGYTTWGRIGNGVFETLGSIGTAWLLGQAVGAIGSAGTTVSTAGGALGGTYAGVATAAPLFSTTSTIFYASQFGGQVQDRVSTLNRNGISYKDMNTGEVISNALTKTALYILFDMAAGKLIGYTNIDKFLKIGQGSGKTGTALGKQLVKGVSTSTGKAAAMVGMNYAIDAAKQGLKTTSRQLISFTVDQFYDKFITDPDQKYNNTVTFKSLGQVFINGFLTSLIMSMFADAKANIREKDRAVGFGDDGPFRLGYFQSINYKNSLRIIGEKINRLNELEKLDKLTEAQRQEYYDTIVMMKALTSTLGDVYKYLDSDETRTIMKFDEAFMMSVVAKAGNIDLYELQKENSRGIIGPQSKLFEQALYSQFKTMDRLGANYAKHYANYLYTTLLDIQGINVEGYQGARTKEAEFTESTSNAKNTTTTKYLDVKDAIKAAESKLQDAQVTKIKSVINSNTKPGSPEVKDLSPAHLTEWQKNLARLGVDTLVGVDGNTVTKSGNVIFVPNDLIINKDLPNVVTGIAYDVAIDTVLASLTKSQLNLIKDSYKEVVGRDDGIEKSVIAFMRDKNFYTYILLKSRERGYGDKAFDTLTIIDQLIKDQANPRVKNGSLSDKAYKTLMKEVQNTMRTGLVTLATNYNKLDLNKISDEILSPELKKQIAEHHNVKFTEFIDEGLSSITSKKKLSTDLIKKRTEDYNRQIDLYRNVLRPEETQILKDKVASNIRNEVRDAYMFLIILANSVKDIGNQKAVYLPAFSGSPVSDIAIYQAMIDLEDTLGVRVPSFLSGHFTEDKLTTSVHNLAKTSGFDLNHRQDRLTIARELLYYKSHKTLTLSSDGIMVKIIPTQELFNNELLGNDGITKLYELARKNDNKIKVKDISKGKLARVIAETDIIFSSDIPEGFAGGLKSSAIHINTNSMDNPLETIAHEITHRTQEVTEVGITKGVGGASQLFKNMRPADKKSLITYISSEFDMTYDLLTDLDYTDNQIIYLMLQGELQSNSYISTVMLESGFRLSADKNTLWSPNGKQAWELNYKYQTTLSPSKPSIPTNKSKPSIPKSPTNSVHSEGILTKKLPSTKNEADIDVAWKEDLKSMSRFVSNETAAKSNLKYWIKKGTPIQIDGRVGNFVVSTTNEFNKLPKVLRDKITTGKLNYYDIIDYVSTANKINNYTFRSIAKHIYGNDELSKLTFNEVQQLIVNITDLAAISKVVDGEELVRAPGQILMLLQATNMKADKDSKLSDELIEAYKGAQRVKIGNQYVDSTPDPKQLVPVFMRHYKGTLESLRHINNFGKLVAANQQALTLLSGVDTEKYKAQGGVWNWLDRMRQADVDYEKDENLVESLEDIDKFDKIRAIENYVVSQITIEINKLSAEEREAKAPELLERYHKTTDNLGKLSESELNKQYLATLANELAEDDQRELDPFLTMKDQPRSTKNIKDHLRQSARMVARRINELNQLNDDNDAIKRLSLEVQKVLNDDYILTPAVYGKLTDKQLERLLEEFKSASKQLNTYIRAAKIKKEARLITQKRIDEMTKKGEKPVDKPKGKTLRDKINVKHTTRIVNQKFTFNSREQITKAAEAMLNTQWGKTGTSKVQGITTNKKQNIHNGETFYRENADTLLSMTTAEAESTVKWFMDANIMDISEDSVEAQSYAAIRLYTLGYIFGQAQDGGQFYNFSHNLKNRLQKYLSTQATLAGTSLAVWNNIREVLNPFKVMFDAGLEMGGVELSEDEKRDLMEAAESGNIENIIKAQRIILDKIKTQKTTSRSIVRKIITIRSMAMLLSPIIWLRYKTSKFMLKPLRNASTKIGEAVFRKKDYAIGQLDMKGQITKEIQAFIDEHIISNGLFDKLVSNLSRYNPSSIQARYKNTNRTPSKDTIFVNMVIESMYNQFYNENMFDSPRLNKLHQSLMKVMSDNNYVREATIKYFGKILAEKKYNLDKGVTDNIMMDFAKAVGIAMKEYMHSNNYFNNIESTLASKSEFGYFMYKLFIPFASTSWNWFKEMMKFTALGLGRAIYRMATLEEQIKKAEENWQKGTSQIPPEFTEFMIRRDLGSGVIGTLMMVLGMMLAGLGFIDLEEKDYGIPKLRIGDLRIDIAKIFGSSSLLAGAALVKGWESENFMDALDAMVEPILDSFILTQIIELDKYHSGGLASFGLNFLENTLLSFIPAGVRWLSGATYSGTYKPNNIFQKAVVRIPFLGSAFNVPKKVNPHTGKEGNMWDAFERVVPYLEIRQTSTIEDNAKALGLNKKELRGKYEINGEKFNLSAREVAELNKAYGEWNATMLRLFYDNQLRKTTQMDNGTYRELTYSQMTEDQRRRAVRAIYEKNAEYAKIQAWLEAGNAYYASDNDYIELKRRGVKGLLYKGNKGFVKK